MKLNFCPRENSLFGRSSVAVGGKRENHDCILRGKNAEGSCAGSTESLFLVSQLCRWKLLSAVLPLEDGNIPVKQLQTHHCRFPMENVDIIKRALSVRRAFCQTFPDLALYLTFCLTFCICEMDVLILNHLYKMLKFVDEVMTTWSHFRFSCFERFSCFHGSSPWI